MSPERQESRTAEAGIVGRSLALRLAERRHIAQHAHDWIQIVHVSHGAIAVEAEQRRWPVTPRRCLWVPAGVPHAIETIRPVAMQTVYLPPDLAPAGPTRTQLFDLTPFSRQVVQETLRAGVLRSSDRLQSSLAVLLAEIVPRAPVVDLELPLPTDPRALRLARLLLDEPGDPRPLAAFCRAVGASTRTLERLFLAETELSIGQWRKLARLQLAVRLLADGTSVSVVALECGYESLSAFVAAFRRTLGVTPGKFFDPWSADVDRPTNGQPRTAAAGGRQNARRTTTPVTARRR